MKIKMIGLQTFAIGVLIAYLAGGASGWYLKGKFYKAAELVKLQASFEDFGEKAQKTINDVHSEFTAQIEKNNKELEKSVESRKEDSEAEARTALTLKETSDALRKIKQSIPLASDVGLCLLTDDFIQLWNDLNAAARSGETEHTGRPTP